MDPLIDQIWAEIEEFPNYEISNWGLIYNKRRKSVMQSSLTTHGHVKISLVNWTGRYTRSVALLVAEAFVPSPDSLCDTVVILDGVLTNVMAENLVWRPQWYAWKYVRQFKVIQPIHYHNLQVDNVQTGASYPSIIDAARKEGLLFDDIWRSTYTGLRTYPNNYTFIITERV